MCLADQMGPGNVFLVRLEQGETLESQAALLAEFAEQAAEQGMRRKVSPVFNG